MCITLHLSKFSFISHLSVQLTIATRSVCSLSHHPSRSSYRRWFCCRPHITYTESFRQQTAGHWCIWRTKVDQGRCLVELRSWHSPTRKRYRPARLVVYDRKGNRISSWASCRWCRKLAVSAPVVCMALYQILWQNWAGWHRFISSSRAKTKSNPPTQGDLWHKFYSEQICVAAGRLEHSLEHTYNR